MKKIVININLDTTKKPLEDILDYLFGFEKGHFFLHRFRIADNSYKDDNPPIFIAEIEVDDSFKETINKLLEENQIDYLLYQEENLESVEVVLIPNSKTDLKNINKKFIKLLN